VFCQACSMLLCACVVHVCCVRVCCARVLCARVLRAVLCVLCCSRVLGPVCCARVLCSARLCCTRVCQAFSLRTPTKPPVWENKNHTQKIHTGEIPVAYPPPPRQDFILVTRPRMSPGPRKPCLPCQARPRDHGNPVFHALHAPGMGLFPALLTSKLDSLLTLHSQWLDSKTMRHHQSPPPPNPSCPPPATFSIDFPVDSLLNFLLTLCICVCELSVLRVCVCLCVLSVSVLVCLCVCVSSVPPQAVEVSVPPVFDRSKFDRGRGFSLSQPHIHPLSQTHTHRLCFCLFV
jgi:hypothetical protein